MTKVSIRPLSVTDAAEIAQILHGPEGLETLRLLGNIVPSGFKITEETERERSAEIIADSTKMAWVILFGQIVVGVIEVNFTNTDNLNAPYTSIFIDPRHRGRGIAPTAKKLVEAKLRSLGYKVLYSRVLIHNEASQRLQIKSGYIKSGKPYTDKDGLSWQNFSKKL
jgi:RimJ/RimL family protein N-acetyltransferase